MTCKNKTKNNKNGNNEINTYHCGRCVKSSIPSITNNNNNILNAMENLVGKVLFPIFAVAHGVMWHTCKFHENNGMCVQLFGLFWDGNHQDVMIKGEEVPMAQHIFARLFSFMTRSYHCCHSEHDLLLTQLHYRLKLVREVNLALAVLCALSSISVKSKTICTQMLFVESVIFGLAAYDASQMMIVGLGEIMTASLSLMVLLFLLALVGLVIQVQKEQAIKEEFFSDISEGEADIQQVPFKKLPAKVQELMVNLAKEVVVAVPPDSPPPAAAAVSSKESSVAAAAAAAADDDDDDPKEDLSTTHCSTTAQDHHYHQQQQQQQQLLF